jgi:hypothetical protein
MIGPGKEPSARRQRGAKVQDGPRPFRRARSAGQAVRAEQSAVDIAPAMEYQ